MPPATSIRTTRRWSWSASVHRRAAGTHQAGLQPRLGHHSMFTQVVAQRLGLEWDLVLGLSVLEGICLTVVLMLLVERYLFCAPVVAHRAPRLAHPPPTPLPRSE